MKIVFRILNFILPRRCLLCKLPFKKDIGESICLDCWKKAKFSNGPSCPICGKPFLSASTLSNSPDYICGICRKRRPYFNRHIYLGPYEGVLLEAIRLFKYKKKVSLAYSLSYLLCKKIKDIPEIDIIIPVPLHIKRLRLREFNQSLLLSKLLGLHLGKPIYKDLIVRSKETIPQVRLDRGERRGNIKNVFSVKDRSLIKGRRILLVDDVFTTGSTADECAKTLNKLGAYNTYVITLAMVNI